MFRFRQSSRVVASIAAFSVVVAACGGSSASDDGVASLEESASDTTIAAAVDDEVDVEQALLDFAACMRGHGIDIEDPTVDADGNVQFGRIGAGQGQGSELDIDRETIRTAREECGEYLESVTLGFRGGIDADFQDTMYEYAQCMRDNGVDMDDPDFSSFGPGAEPGEDGEPQARRPFGDIDPDDPAFQAAQEACGDILAGFGPGRVGGPGGRPGG